MIPKFRAWHVKDKYLYPVAILSDLVGGLVAEGAGAPGHSSYGKTLWVGKDVILMQSTGLKDKNGVEIFEGDILKHDLWGNSEIIWEHGMFRGKGSGHDVTLADHQLKRSRIIGNIHEHSHLAEAPNANKS